MPEQITATDITQLQTMIDNGDYGSFYEQLEGAGYLYAGLAKQINKWGQSKVF